MPLPLISHVLKNGIDSVPYLWSVLRTIPFIALVVLIKMYTSGATCKSERLMKSKVIMITGGTSGIGAAVVRSLAQKGASLILLSSQPPSDPFLVDYIEDLRKTSGNQLIYAEQVDLGSLHSIRQFATKWIDNAPPRRLDMIILCAATMVPKLATLNLKTKDGLEPCWGINYLANFHLLSILSPAIRAQPPDRDVRIIMTTCTSYIGGRMAEMKDSKSPLPAGFEYPTSKLALMTFAQAFQKHLEAYVRPDKAPNNARVILVDPGTCRTPGTRRWLTLGSIWGLALYLILWPIWWLLFKSADGGAEPILTAIQDPAFSAGLISADAMDTESKLGVSTSSQAAGNVTMVRECREVRIDRPEIMDDDVAKELWAFSERQIMALEKEGAVRRAVERKAAENSSTKADGLVKETQLQLNKTTANTGKDTKTPGSRRSRKQ